MVHQGRSRGARAGFGASGALAAIAVEDARTQRRARVRVAQLPWPTNGRESPGPKRIAADLLLGLACLAIVTFVCFELNLSLAAAGFADLTVITVLSLRGRYLPLVVLSFVAVAALNYFFVPPLFTFRINYAQDLIILSTFVISSVVITGLVRRMRELADEVALVVNTIPVIAWSKLPDGSADFVNGRFRDYTGLSSADVLGWGWIDAFHPDDRVVDSWRAAFAAGKPFEKDARLRRSDGTHRWCVLRDVPLRDARGRIVRWYGTAIDIDDRKAAEGVLREQAGLLDLTHDSMFVADMNDVITYWNRGAEKLYGWKSAEAIGRATHDLLQTRFPAPLADINATLRRAHRWEGELVQTKRDGTRVVVASRWALQLDERGTAAAVLETNNDITERKRAEDALRQQADLLEQTHDAVIVCGFRGTIVYWNRGAENLYGFTREEVIGRLTDDLLRTEHAISTEPFRAMLERDGAWSGEVTQTTRDGRKVIVDSRRVLVDRPDGRLVLETNRDITDRSRAEYLTAQVFQSSPYAISTIGRDYRFQRVNPVFARHWNIAAERVVGMHAAELFGADAFERVHRPRLDRCFAGEQVAHAGWLDLPGGRRYRAITWSPLRPHSEQVEGALVVAHDLTDHVLAADALRETQAALARVARVTTLGEVTASIAHELNQPLAAIVNNASASLALLREGSRDIEEVRAALADIVSDGERASAIIERVRALAKRSPPEKRAVAVGDIVADVVALTASESAARHVAIHTDIAADLPNVMGDRVQLQQVLLNLVVNGMDAMSAIPEAARLLEIRVKGDDHDGVPSVRVAVRDSGIGLDPVQLERVFEAFYTTKPQGMGMGLAICRSIIASHGGRLWGEPNRGPGATFTFLLPIAN